MRKESEKNMVRIPSVKSLETALYLYYSKLELSGKDIRELFEGNLSSSTVTRLKGLARKQMAVDGVQSWNAAKVNTRSSFKAWGLSINDIEERFSKLKQLNLL